MEENNGKYGKKWVSLLSRVIFQAFNVSFRLDLTNGQQKIICLIFKEFILNKS